MQTALIFHGTGGYPQENWFPWLKEQLEARGLGVFVPQFPTPEGQSLEAWLKILDLLKNKINQDSIIIGHSLGGIFALRVLEQVEQPIKLAVFVATPIGVGTIKNYEGDKAFSGFDFDWDKIRTSAKNFIVYHSNNDPYVSIENGQQLAQHLGVELTFIPDAGHFNKTEGYLKFENLLKKLGTFT